MTQVISSERMPVRDRLRAQPTLAATVFSSFAIATMWHCGLPSIGMSGKASFSVIRPRPLMRSSTTSGGDAASASGP